MSAGSSLGVAPRLADSSAEWLVRISTREPGRSTLASRHAGAVRVWFTGRLFDREDLRRRTASSADATDADLVRAAYVASGSKVFGDLRGRFALALTDETTNTAFVVRDPLGTYPVFHADGKESLLVAASPQRLTAQPGVSTALNTAALADRLCRRWPRHDETFFAAVRRLLPGRMLVITPGRIRVERSWDPAPLGQPVAWLSDDEADRFDALFERSVARCLEPGRAGIFLSGGLDSISVAAIAADVTARAGRNRPLALSLAFPDPVCDERLRQASVAKTLGLPLHLVDFWDAVGPRGLLPQALDLSATLASPLMNTWGPAYQSLARGARAAGVEAILTGMGGDEWLTVSPLVTADFLAQGRFTAAAGYLRSMLRSHTLGRGRIAWSVLWSFGLRPLAGRTIHRLAPITWDSRRAARRVAGDPSWVAPDRKLRAALLDRAPSHLGPADPPDGFYVHELRSSIDDALVSWELEEQFQFGEQAGVEFGHPFWDADLVDALLRTPPDRLSRGGLSKGLVRQSVARRFPSLGLDRQRKVSGTAFYRSVLAREGASALDSLGDLAVLHDLGVVDGPRARAFVRDAWNGTPEGWSDAWSLASLEAWARVNSGTSNGGQ